MKTSRLLLSIVVSSFIATAATAADKSTPADAQALLDKAIKEVAKVGLVKASAEFNDSQGGFQQGELYVFCYDAAHKIVANPNPAVRGQDFAALKDPDGKPIGSLMLDLVKKGGGSIDYRWPNPVTKKVESKTTFVKPAAEGGCGVGAYK